MAKQRIQIKGIGGDNMLLLKYIIQIKIDGVVYYKSSALLELGSAQKFYKFINKNRMQIEWLNYIDPFRNQKFRIHLCELKVHNESGPAIIDWYGDHYMLNGIHYKKHDWIIKLRKEKLLKLGG